MVKELFAAIDAELAKLTTKELVDQVDKMHDTLDDVIEDLTGRRIRYDIELDGEAAALVKLKMVQLALDLFECKLERRRQNSVAITQPVH